ncbi:MAG TPA: hypothetical protein PKC91_08680 [Ignavibacteria bacterium]|nr:hypothetical protein [Ignavibacteria bacterium]
MKISQEIINLKKEIKKLNSKLEKLNQTYVDLTNTSSKQKIVVPKKRECRKLSYIEWLNNERRMKNLLSPF